MDIVPVLQMNVSRGSEGASPSEWKSEPGLTADALTHWDHQAEKYTWLEKEGGGGEE